MIEEERLLTFLKLFQTEGSPLLGILEKEARDAEVPIIRKDTQQALRAFLAMHQPGTILEIGTAVGFSSVFFCECSDARVVTIENYGKRIPIAKENIRRFGYASRITLLEGDAEEILPSLGGPFDMIFLDAAQGQYIHFLPELKRLLRSGGILVTDNVLLGGDLLESHYAVQRRKRTIYRRMREYLHAITKDDALVTTILPVGDGLALTVKK